MYIGREFSIAVAEEPGEMAQILRELAASGINIVALMLTAPIGQRELRVISDDEERARELFGRLGVRYGDAEVLCVNIAEEPGSLVGLMANLEKREINVLYAYYAKGARDGKATAVLGISDVRRAIEFIQKAFSETREFAPINR